MKRLCVMLAVGLVFVGFQVAGAAVVFQDLGTAAPPATLGTYNVTAFDQTPQNLIADFDTTVTTIPGSPIPGNLTSGTALDKRTVGASWSFWSNGYTGVVYFNAAGTDLTITLPPNTGAFYLYAEPNNLGLFAMTATTNGGGAASGSINVDGNGGANGFGFFTTAGESITSITITADPNAAGFAIGEFGAALAQQPLPPAATATIPTMNQLGLTILALLLVAGSILFLRKKRSVC